MTRSQFHRTGLYAECYRALGAEFQLAAPLPNRRRRDVRTFIAVNRRRRDFTADERRFLDLARHVVTLALRNVEAFDALERRCHQLQTALEECDQAVAMADWRGRIRLRTAYARVLLEKYFERGRPPAWLPEPLRAWARQWIAELGRGTGTMAGRPLIVERGGERLVVRLLPDGARNEFLLLFEERRADPSPMVEGLGLSGRESEVLSWVARGKTNADVAAILAISPRTVQKHLEHVFEKLGVETRTAAVARARQWLDC
jgi:DNA-binding CsgD family transcriptional regulator